MSEVKDDGARSARAFPLGEGGGADRNAMDRRGEAGIAPRHLSAIVVDEVIPRLLDNCRRASGAPGLGATHVDTLARLAIGRDPEAAAAHVAALRAGGFGAQEAMTELIGPAAHRLGDFWLCDSADFAEVAIGAARLTRIARGLGLEAEQRAPADAPRALIASPRAERHGIGALIVAQGFRTAGWRVTGMPGAPDEEIVAEAASGGYHLVGLSIGSTRALEGAAALVARIRRRSGAAIALGGHVFSAAPERALGLGADFMATDAADALRKTRAHLSRRAPDRVN